MRHAGASSGKHGRAAGVGGCGHRIQLDVGIQNGAFGGVGDHRRGRVDPAEPLGLEAGGQLGIGEKQSGGTRYVDARRDIARTIVADDDGLGAGGSLENADTPMQAGIHAGGMQEFVGELHGVVEMIVLGFGADHRRAGAGGGDTGCGKDARRHGGRRDAGSRSAGGDGGAAWPATGRDGGR